MRTLIGLLLVCVAAGRAATITNVTVTNLSTADFSRVGGEGQIEFRSGVTSYSPPSQVGPFVSMTAVLGWLFAARSPEGVVSPLAENVVIGYEVSFTVEDPLNEGYMLGVNSSLNGWLTAQWSFGDTEALGAYLGDFDADVSRNGTYVNAPNLQLPGGSTSASVDVVATNDPVVNFAGAFSAVIQTGTANYSVRYYTPLALLGTTGPAGEVAMRFGMQPTLGGFTIAGTPGEDGEEASLHGLSTEIYMLSLGDGGGGGVTEAPEPGTFALMGGALLGLVVWRRR
jgi:hypothetical protein